jgi:hypothetical protein
MLRRRALCDFEFRARKYAHYQSGIRCGRVGDLKATLDKPRIANQEQKGLLSIIESARERVVDAR